MGFRFHIALYTSELILCFAIWVYSATRHNIQTLWLAFLRLTLHHSWQWEHDSLLKSLQHAACMISAVSGGILHLVRSLLWSAVCSLQSAVCILPWFTVCSLLYAVYSMQHFTLSLQIFPGLQPAVCCSPQSVLH